MAQFTYLTCVNERYGDSSRINHVICIDGKNHNVFEIITDNNDKYDGHNEHSTKLRFGSFECSRSLKIKNTNRTLFHLAEVVLAIEVCRFVWTHLGKLEL